MTSVDIDRRDPAWNKEVTLRVHSSGHVLHAFVNEKHVGTHWAKDGKFKFYFESKFRMKNGNN
ncbi:hypothetical protein Acr_15g0010640 [Actinidia rufa]|uniref:Beta-galactosidase galactose-binding domain-containing protein n=1 Tax=Actinidia rufa TaxID=165716 RepID=A0A7J0FUS8_9ERIC|nr:hypothetical protein Acr_15g0010640 [Actinidia rufa]